MQLFSADATIFLKRFAPENMKKPPAQTLFLKCRTGYLDWRLDQLP